MIEGRAPDPALQWLQRSYRMPPAACLPALPHTGISLTRWRRTEARPSHLIENPNSSYLLSLILRPMRGRAWFGAMPVWSGPIAANTIRLTPSGMEPRWQCDGAFDFLLLTIPDHTIETIAGAEAPRLHENLSRNPAAYFRDDIVLQICHNMLQTCGSQWPHAQQFADGLGYALVAHLLDRHTVAAGRSSFSLSPSKLRRVSQHIAEHLDQQISVADLAAVAGLSESHFAHAFRASTGATPHRFVNSGRIERARCLLADSDKPVAEIALDCGFKDASHFARVFRAVCGVTPREFRRAL